MLCKPDEAKNYKCCAMDKQCEGTACMAWRIHYTEDSSAPQRYGYRNLPLPKPVIDSGKGYCGKAHK